MRRAYPLYLALFLFMLVGGLLLVTDAGPAQARGLNYEASQSLSSGHGPLPSPSDADHDGDDPDGDRGTGDDDAPGETVKHENCKSGYGAGAKLPTWIMFRYAAWFMVP